MRNFAKAFGNALKFKEKEVSGGCRNAISDVNTNS
jgi:hypothetical protein